MEGIDGSGTSTHSHLLKGFLESKGFKVYLTKEPSESDIGKLIRKYLKDENVPPATDALLFATDRNLHFHNEIKKKLEEGYIVISDRYLESSIVYQSIQSDQISVEWIIEINKFVDLPDITIILDIDPKTALERKEIQDWEKFEDISFLDKARDLYTRRAKQNGYSIISSDDIIEFVQERIQKIIMNRLKDMS